MKKIMCAKIEVAPSSISPIYYQVGDSSELDGGQEALEQGLSLRGIVENVVENAQKQDEYTATVTDIWGTIHNVQPDAVFVQNENGEPVEMYWVTE